MKQSEDRTQRIFRGRFRRAGQKYLAIQLDHIPKITEFLLKHSYFTVGGMVFRQIQGASMGSHFAPALCGLVAALQEYCFHKAFHGKCTIGVLQMDGILIGKNRLICKVVRPLQHRLRPLLQVEVQIPRKLLT